MGFFAFGEILLLGLRNLWRNRLRSTLTMLGIIFGVGSVIAMMSVGAGARAAILERIGELGVRNIIVNSIRPPEDNKPNDTDTSRRDEYGIEFSDADYIEEVLSSVERLHRVNQSRERAWYQGRRAEVVVQGVEPDYLGLFRLTARRGRTFNPIDASACANVCLVRPGLVRSLEILSDPLGTWIQLGAHAFEIIGILDEAGFQSPTKKALALDALVQDVYVPYSTAGRTFGTVSYTERGGTSEYKAVDLDQVVIEVASVDDVPVTSQMLTAVLAHRHDRRDYEIVVPLELLEQQEQAQRVFHLVMLLIAAISLLVGGIGIANIMLATITERTREIGVRRALGARRKDIAAQFLTETVALAVLGGLAGCVLGIAGSHLIARVTGWPSSVSPDAVLISLSISCAVGVLFGLFPARRAARLDPIASLRRD